MKRFFSLSLITLALLIGAAGALPSAYAQQTLEEAVDAASAMEDYAGDLYPTDNGASIMNDIQAANAISAASKAPAPPGDPKTNEAYNGVMQKILELFAWLLGVSAIVLNYAVYYTVVTMGAYVSGLSAIGVTWTILRDIGNIALIFGFLAVGVTTILNVDWYGKGTKMLPMMFVAAVFLNFSLFFTEAIIDTGNLFATQFYTQIVGEGSIKPPNMTMASVTNEGISNRIMNQLGLATLYNAGNPDILKNNSPWLVGFMGIILFIVTAFVFFALAFILIARFVILIFLIVLAPIGFAGLAVPMLAKRAGQWWDKLFEQTVTAPILLLMLYVALRVITDTRFLSGFSPTFVAPGAATGFIENANLPAFGGFILSFVVAMGLLIAVVIQSKNLSAFGASWASKTAGALTFGLTAAGMRATGGWAAQRASQVWRKTQFSRAPIIGRAVSGVLDRGAKASFDARGVKVGGYGLTGGKVDAGKAQEGGFRDWEKEKVKEREEYAKTLGQTFGPSVWGKSEEKRQAEAEKAQKDAEGKLKTLTAELPRKKQDLLGKQKVELESLNDGVDKAQKDLAQLQENERRGGTVTPAEMEAAKKALTDARTAREGKMGEHRAQQGELEKDINDQRKIISDSKEEIAKLKRAPQEGYANSLRLGIDQTKGGFWRGTVNFINPQRNTKSADNIIKDAAKSKTEKDFDALKKLLEDTAKKEDKPKEEKPKEEKPKEEPKA